MLPKDYRSYELEESILSALRLLKYRTPTKIQEEVLPFALQGRDIVAKSQTGSGKTAAFAIPLCQKADWDCNEPGSLVLEPTRELTVQVKEEIFHIGRNKRLKVADVFGGFPIDKQIQTLKQKNHIVVGTPGRVLDHIRRGSLKLENIQIIVIDEADLMLDMGFAEDVQKIINAAPECQMMLFSATLGEHIEKLVKSYMKNPVEIRLEEETETAKSVTQKVIYTCGEDKYMVFLNTLEKQNPDSCMVFCDTREMVNVLCHKMQRDGIKCKMIHGEIDQQERLRTIDEFRQGRFRYLIATDVAARGIDFQNLTHVFNYDFPTGRENYVHRIGRTGRNGEAGVAISFLTENETKLLKAVEEYIHLEIPAMEASVSTEEEKAVFKNRQSEKIKLRERKGAEFKKTITRLTIGGGKKSKMRAVDIVGAISNIDGITAEDIGIIDVRESYTHVEILNGKGRYVVKALQSKPIKGKLRKVK